MNECWTHGFEEFFGVFLRIWILIWLDQEHGISSHHQTDQRLLQKLNNQFKCGSSCVFCLYLSLSFVRFERIFVFIDIYLQSYVAYFWISFWFVVVLFRLIDVVCFTTGRLVNWQIVVATFINTNLLCVSEFAEIVVSSNINKLCWLRHTVRPLHMSPLLQFQPVQGIWKLKT